MISSSALKGPKGPLRHRCAQCAAAGANLKLLRCSACLAVRYCSREHQAAHRPDHKSGCTKIRRARAKLAEEDHGVRNVANPDFMTPANAFETSVGHFWGILSTRDYMRARCALVGDHLLLMGTLDAVAEALGQGHMWDMLRLCRSDNLGVRDQIPALMLRLDLDQECYDFVKWWATCDPDGRYNWGDTSLPYLDVSGADAFEEVGFLARRRFGVLDHLVAILLLKLKLLVDIRNIKLARKVLSHRGLPAELWEPIELAVIRSPLSVKLRRESTASLAKAEMKLLAHIRQLGAAVVEANGQFMFHLFEPDDALEVRPEFYSAGSWEEITLAMQRSYAAWWETEGVLDLLDDARACGARNSENEIQDMMKFEKSRQGRTAEELLADVSVNRI